MVLHPQEVSDDLMKLTEIAVGIVAMSVINFADYYNKVAFYSVLLLHDLIDMYSEN